MTPAGPALRRAISRPAAWISLLWLLVISLACGLASVLAPDNPLKQNLSATFAGPSAAHWLGTDELGRDVLSRLLYGGGGLLAIALIPVAVSLIIGVPSGLAAGYQRGRVDAAASFLVDVMFALPGLVVVLAVAAVTGNNLIVMTLVFGIITSGGIFRVVRSATAAVRDMPYVDAALVARLSRRRILARHVLPNIAGPLVVQSFVQYSGTFLFITSLSFLGLGFSPETPSWGQLTATATQYLYQDPWLMVPVGIALTGTVLALNLVGFAVLKALTDHRRPSLMPQGRPARRGAPGIRPAGPARLKAVPRLPAAPASPEVALAVEDLHVSFPGPDGTERPVVDGVSLRVTRGEAFGLVGESGSGKTTTALAVLGLVPPPGRIISGRILLDGEDLLQGGEARFRAVRGSGIGLVSQEPMAALDPCFTVGSQLRELIRLHHGRRGAAGRALQLLSDVGLPAPDVTAGRYPHQLSGGTAQRVSIAMALSREPHVLVADEPTTALDVTVQADWLERLGVGYRPMPGKALGVEPSGWSNHPSSFRRVMDLLRERVEAAGGQVITRAAVTGLVGSPTTGVTAVIAETADGPLTITTGRVLLTTGGFTGNVSLLEHHFKGVYDESIYWTDAKRLAGDGIALADSVGADINGPTALIKENCYSFKTKKNKPNRAATEPSSLWVNRRGERFLDESLGFVNASVNALVAQPGMAGFALFDDALLQQMAERPDPFAAELRPGEDDPNTWTAEGYRRNLRDELTDPANGEWCTSARDWAQIAAWIGAAADVLAATVDQYNGCCDSGHDSLWAKDPALLIPLRKAPFYALRFRPLMIDTSGPVVVDSGLHVLDRRRRPIPGLFAAGSVTSGWIGADEHRFGTPLSWAISSGRTAGAAAARGG